MSPRIDPGRKSAPRLSRILLLASLSTLATACAQSEMLAPTLPTLTITTATLPDAVLGVRYTTLVSATGGSPSYVWSVIDGALPAGLTIASNGAITGTPTAVGTASFMVQVTSADAQNATKEFDLVVAPPPL